MPDDVPSRTGPAGGTGAPGSPGRRDPVTTGLLLAAAAYVGWGLLSPLSKLLLEDFTPLWIHVLRGLLSLAILVPLIGWAATAEGMRLMRRPVVLAIAILGGGLSIVLFQYALARQSATYTTLAFYTAPLWTAVLARLMLKERLGWSFAPALVGLGVGAWFALFGLDGTLQGADGWGMLLSTTSGLTWAAYTVLLRRHGSAIGVKPLLFTLLAGTFLFFLVGALVAEPLPDLGDVRPVGWGRMAALVAVPSLASFFLFTASLQRAPAAKVNILVGLEIASTLVFAYFLLDESLDAARLAGVGVVLASVSLYLWWQSRAGEASAA